MCHLWKRKTGDKGIGLEEKIEFHLGYAAFEMFVRHLRGVVKQADYLLNIMSGKSMTAALMFSYFTCFFKWLRLFQFLFFTSSLVTINKGGSTV